MILTVSGIIAILMPVLACILQIVFAGFSLGCIPSLGAVISFCLLDKT